MQFYFPKPGQFKNDCVKTFIFRMSRRKVKQAIFHLVSSPAVPDFQSLAPKGYFLFKGIPHHKIFPQNALHFGGNLREV